MKITVLTSSPRKNGTSNFMADAFISGAQEVGHEVYRFDTAKADIKPCIACDACAMGTKPCIQKDDFAQRTSFKFRCYCVCNSYVLFWNGINFKKSYR